MKYRQNVTSDVMQPQVEHNCGHVYFRWDFKEIIEPATEESEERTIYQYKEYYMTNEEYETIRLGKFTGTHTEGTRMMERSYLYDVADQHIMKYTTDSLDPSKSNSWIEYKRQVRATPSLPSYPQEVTYPTKPLD